MSMIMMGFIYPLDKHSWLHSLKKCQKSKIYLSESIIIMIVISRGSEKSQIRQYLGFCTAEFWPLLVYESAVQKPKHCPTWGFWLPPIRKILDFEILSPSLIIRSVRRRRWWRWRRRARRWGRRGARGRRPPRSSPSWRQIAPSGWGRLQGREDLPPRQTWIHLRCSKCSKVTMNYYCTGWSNWILLRKLKYFIAIWEFTFYF